MPKYEIRLERESPLGKVIAEVEVDEPDGPKAMEEAMRLINAYYGRPWIQDQIRSLSNYGH